MTCHSTHRRALVSGLFALPAVIVLLGMAVGPVFRRLAHVHPTAALALGTLSAAFLGLAAVAVGLGHARSLAETRSRRWLAVLFLLMGLNHVTPGLLAVGQGPRLRVPAAVPASVAPAPLKVTDCRFDLEH